LSSENEPTLTGALSASWIMERATMARSPREQLALIIDRLERFKFEACTRTTVPARLQHLRGTDGNTSRSRFCMRLQASRLVLRYFWTI
jgi:hypothetical protein